LKKLVDIRKVGEKEACEFVREILDYNPSTGVLTWKVRDHKWSHATHFNSRFAGKRVGSIEKTGYLRCRINNVGFLAHRIAYLHYYGVWPDQVDHINHNKTDNRISNMRDVNASHNHRNKLLRSDRFGSVIGVRRDRLGKKWRAAITVNREYKSLGTFDDFNSAVLARKNAEQLYNFHPNHGR